MGSLDWKDYSVSADFLLDTTRNVALYGRIGTILENDNLAAGYCLKVTDAGDWELQAAAKVISSGKVSFSCGVWHQLGLEFKCDSIDVMLDKASVALVKDETFTAGMVGLGCGWHEAQFDNLMVQQAGSGFENKTPELLKKQAKLMSALRLRVFCIAIVNLEWHFCQQ